MKKFIRLSYYPTESFASAINLIESKRKNADFIDGIMFSKNSGIIMVGNFSENAGSPIIHFTKTFNEWFYLHIEKKLTENNNWEELIPIKDYLFRYDRGAFWMGKYAFDFLRIPFNLLTRFIFNVFCTTRRLYFSMQSVNIAQQYFIQDICVPIEKTLKILNLADSQLDIYPIWLCPGKPDRNSKLSPAYLNSNLVIDIGIWGGNQE